MFLNYENFDACVADQLTKGLDGESAKKVCGSLQAKYEGKEVTGRQVERVMKAVAEEVLKDFEAAHSEDEITEVFILGDNEIVTRDNLREQWVNAASQGSSISREPRQAVAKAYEGSTTSLNDIGQGTLAGGIHGEVQEVDPPYDPVVLRTFLELDALHYRAVKAKVADSVGRSLKYESTVQVIPDDSEEEFLWDTIDQSTYDAELKVIKEFTKNCNDIIGWLIVTIF